MTRIFAIFLAMLYSAAAFAGDPITIAGETTPSPSTPIAPRVEHFEIFHATSGSWTYNHHPDMAEWKGRLYVAWDSCKKDEDIGISRELYSITTDGSHWSAPALLFPQGTSTALRMYFFLAPAGRMLAIAGARTSANISESAKGALIVREIHADHSLGPVYLLREASAKKVNLPPYTASSDQIFITSCKELLVNKTFLEQEDYGQLLGSGKMKWHDVRNWSTTEPSRADFPRFGKAMCFYHRADGTLVDVMKWGFVTVSHDEGKTWSQPTIPKTLITGMAKVWAQRTSNNKYVLIYNPDREKRYPLVMVTSDDGITFSHMQILRADHPPIRFPGLNKVEGPQYPRGISEFSNDHTFADKDIFIAYSLGKEDIYVTKIQPSAMPEMRN